ncbi:MAG: hypothetical protein IJC25_00530 [Clostridia bacterium]|nr:hypothetical protein [Clostridia bacterium]
MFNQHLYPDETVLWEGKPSVEQEFKHARERVLYLIAGLVLGFVCFFAGAYIGSAPDRLNLLMTLGLALLLATAAWFGVATITHPTPNRRLLRTYYAVTDQRILILRGDKLSQYGLNEVVVKYYKFPDAATALALFDNEADIAPSSGAGFDNGTFGNHIGIRFGLLFRGAIRNSKNIPGALAGLYCIQNPIQIEQLIKQAQKDAKTNRTY